MKSAMKKTSLAALAMGLTAWMAIGSASAQTVYRVVGADGKVTFSDKPPVNTGNAASQELASIGAASSNQPLPFALRQVVAKYPVTLVLGRQLRSLRVRTCFIDRSWGAFHRKNCQFE